MENSIQGYDAATASSCGNITIQRTYVHPNLPTFIDGYLYCTPATGWDGVMLKVSLDEAVSRSMEIRFIDPKIGGVVVFWTEGSMAEATGQETLLPRLENGQDSLPLTSCTANIISNDGLLYVYSERGNISLIEPKTDGFNIISTFNVPLGSGTHWAHTVINNKRLYVRHGNSLMVYSIARIKLKDYGLVNLEGYRFARANFFERLESIKGLLSGYNLLFTKLWNIEILL